MGKTFKNILVPVDFSINTEIAVKKAMELMDELEPAVHLLHVSSWLRLNHYFPVNGFWGDAGAGETGQKLEQWRTAILENHPSVRVVLHVLRAGNVQSAIARLALSVEPELIIIGKHRAHNWCTFLNTVSPGTLALATQCPVLTVKTGSLRNKVRSIVYPVNGALTAKKMEVLVGLSGRYRARVYLAKHMSADEDGMKASYTDFIDTYRLLKQSVNGPIDYVVLPGPSLALSALHFAETIKADMLLLPPGRSITTAGLPNPQVNDLIRGDSKLEVLSIA